MVIQLAKNSSPNFLKSHSTILGKDICIANVDKNGMAMAGINLLD